MKSSLQAVLIALFVILSSASVWAYPLSVVSFNTWGVPFLVQDTWRYSQAMRAIEQMNPDIVLLQEVFSAKGKRNFQSYQYPYRVDGPRAFPRLVNSGLRILSKYPIVRSAIMTFWRCVKDDCLSRKGALLAVIQLPDGQLINVLTTHLNARGDDSVRVAQVDQISLFIDEFKEPGAPLFIAGDFNFDPTSPAYPYTLSKLGVTDAWEVLHPGDPGITSDGINNHYAYDYCMKTNCVIAQQRIDLHLFRDAENGKMVPQVSHLIFNQEPLYSDHYGLFATYEVVGATKVPTLALSDITEDNIETEEETQSF